MLGLAMVAIVAPVDKTPVTTTGFHSLMMERLASAKSIEASGELQSGWETVSITPRHPMPMAGYAPRDSYTVVHDSLYARILAIRSGELQISFISLDLLLFPPTLRDRLSEKLDSAGISQHLYLAATHTHNGMGGWDDSFVGSWSVGKFDRYWIESTANTLVTVLSNIDVKPSKINYWQSDASEMVENRVDRENGKTDGMLRGIEIVRTDSSTAIVSTYSAHPTSIDRKSRELSADYPGALTSKLEDQFDFAMFMAGMVGSHRFARVPQSDYDFIDYVTPILTEKITERKRDELVGDARVSFLSQPIEFGPSQLRISNTWKVRDWLFRTLLRPLAGNVVMTEIGNIVFIGLPCDFSGEIYNVEGLEALARSQGKRLIITSFNGDYDGYITLDKHYEVSHAEEIRALNWVGPGYGQYFATIVKGLIEGKN
jgi:neutral ceramidase